MIVHLSKRKRRTYWRKSCESCVRKLYFSAFLCCTNKTGYESISTKRVIKIKTYQLWVLLKPPPTNLLTHWPLSIYPQTYRPLNHGHIDLRHELMLKQKTILNHVKTRVNTDYTRLARPSLVKTSLLKQVSTMIFYDVATKVLDTE